MDNLIIEGKLLQVLDPQEGVSTRGAWKKQDFVLETADQYPKKICISCWNEKADELKNYQPNDAIKVSINIESREYNSKWYTDIKAWKLEKVGASTENTPATSQDSEDVTGMSFSDDAGDDLPF
ncbi:MAG: hypothetical protein COA58_02695 [Bacteroidetes bacterium]|nr:MAG: hypothetical protein COA58_02695 [Bacteroidota bacterium]